MTDDATLSAFGDETAAETDDEPSSDPDEERSDLATYAWGSYSCRRCGRDTDRVWRDDGEFVCPACKSWDSTN